jgi:FAD binding domain
MTIDLNAECTNEHKNVTFVAEKKFNLFVRNPDGSKPTTTQKRWKMGAKLIQKIISSAELERKKVRAIGANWSLSEVSINTEYVLNTAPMNALLRPQIESTVGDSKNFVLAQSGLKILDLNRVLASDNMALSTSGASDGQTIVGAVSTGTHGAAITFGAMPDFVKGLHIITSSTEHFWIEPKEKYLTQAYLDANFDNVVRINDDKIFNAALVSFGSFGVVHGVLLECEPQYFLSIFQRTVNWEDVRNHVNGPSDIDLMNLAINPYHFEIDINPFKDIENAILRVMYKHPFDPETDSSASEGGNDEIISEISADLIGIMGKITDTFPATTALLIKLLDSKIKANFPDFNGELFFPNEIFSGSEMEADRVKGMSIEIGIDANQVLTVVEIIMEEAKKVPFLGLVALRYIKKSRATLAFTKFDTTCAIEIPAVFSHRTLTFYENLWNRLDAEGIIFTSHWGQMNDLDDTKLRKRWGANLVEEWIESRNTLLKTAAQRNMFSNDFVNNCGLNSNVV